MCQFKISLKFVYFTIDIILILVYIITIAKNKIKKAVRQQPRKTNRHQSKKKGKPIISQSAKWCKIMSMRFENLFNTMHCDFFEIHKNGEMEKIEYEASGKMLAASKKYFDCIVKDFYIIRAKNSNELGLMIIL